MLSPKEISLAAEILAAGGLVALPTETVYGLAADALNPQAIAKIFEAKGRPADNPLIVHIAGMQDVCTFAKNVPELAAKLMEKFWPGPLTVVLESSGVVPREISAGLSSVALRMPSHPVFQAVLAALRRPLAAPSANISGRPSGVAAAHVLKDLGGRIDAVIDGGPSEIGIESTVVSFLDKRPRLLRPGAVTLEEIEQVLSAVDVDETVLKNLEVGQAASPGMKYRHYAPQAQVTLVSGSTAAFVAFLRGKVRDGVWALCFDEEVGALPVSALAYGSEKSSETLASGVFSALRQMDELGAKEVFVHAPQQTGIGFAVFNRLLRCAEFRLVKLCDDE